MKKCAKFAMIDSKIYLMTATCLTFLVIWMVFLGVTMAYGPSFSSQFFYVVARDRASENIIVSPNSVRTALAWLYLGAEYSTAAEIQIEAQIRGHSKQEVAKTYGNLFAQTSEWTTANRIFVDQRFEIQPEFAELSRRYFGNYAERLNFLEPTKALETINIWTAIQTDGYVKNLLSPETLKRNTTSIVVNSNAFSAKWMHEFDPRDTQPSLFYVNNTYISSVYMMFQENFFLYGNFPEIGARGIELPFNNSNHTMLILLPYGAKDLASLEESLKHFSFFFFQRRMRLQKIHLHMPKFQFQFSLSLQPILEELGVRTMFTPQANFQKLVNDFRNFSVTEFLHHAFIDIDEFGIRKKSKEGAKNQPLPLKPDMDSESFKLNHPFVFAIKDHKSVLLSGHIAEL